jgi:hypothetical protein
VNRCQPLASTETVAVQYISEYPGIERLSNQHWVDESYPKSLGHVFEAFPRNTAKYCVGQEWWSGTPQRHHPVEFDGVRFDTACIFYSQAIFDKVPLNIIVGTYSMHASEQCIPTSNYRWMIHNAPFDAYVLSSWKLWICGLQYTLSVIVQTPNIELKARLISLGIG